MFDHDDSIMDIVDAVTCEGDVVALIHAYFDESVDAGLAVLGVYVFRKPPLAAFEQEWRAMLRKYGLPYFRMSACNASNAYPFQHLSDEEKDNCARMAIRAINNHALLGFSVACNVSDFEQVLKDKSPFKSPYEYLIVCSMAAIRSWAIKNGHSSRISCFFEAGYADQTIANGTINKIMSLGFARDYFLYRSHSFLSKDDSLAIQAADVLAWQVCKNAKRALAGNFKSRGDYIALTHGNVEHMLTAASRPLMEDYVKSQRLRHGPDWDNNNAHWRDANTFQDFVRAVSGGVFPDELRHL